MDREQNGIQKVEITFSLKAKEHYIDGDEARLEQVFRNLLRNAVKFTPNRGRVRIETRNPIKGTVVVSVTDTGIGIPPDRLGSVFNAFEQGGHEVTRSFGGLGLGLAIAKGIIEAHGGGIHVQSNGAGCGTCFAVELQTKAAPNQSFLPERAIQTSVKGLRLLLVEDHEDSARVLARLLSKAQYKVMTAHSCKEARQIAAVHPIDLVVSDLGLPDGSGHELMRELNLHFGLKGIALTGYGTEADVEKSTQVGFVAHLTKPVDWPSLRAALAQTLVHR